MHADSVNIIVKSWVTSEWYENIGAEANLLKHFGFRNSKKYEYIIYAITVDADFSSYMRIGQLTPIPNGYNLTLEILRRSRNPAG